MTYNQVLPYAVSMIQIFCVVYKWLDINNFIQCKLQIDLTHCSHKEINI
jgi:hypothetical protein